MTTSHAECLDLADALSRTPIALHGSIEQIHVVSVAPDAVASVRAFDLERLTIGGSR